MKLIPASRAFATIRVEVASSVGPPNIMVPRQIGETFRPLRPSSRYCMGKFLICRDEDSGLAPTLREQEAFVASRALQNFEKAIGRSDAALADADFGVDEDEAPRGAHH